MNHPLGDCIAEAFPFLPTWKTSKLNFGDYLSFYKKHYTHEPIGYFMKPELLGELDQKFMYGVMHKTGRKHMHMLYCAVLNQLGFILAVAAACVLVFQHSGIFELLLSAGFLFMLYFGVNRPLARVFKRRAFILFMSGASHLPFCGKHEKERIHEYAKNNDRISALLLALPDREMCNYEAAAILQMIKK